MLAKTISSQKASEQEKFAAFKAKRDAQKLADQQALAAKFPLLFGGKGVTKVDKSEVIKKTTNANPFPVFETQNKRKSTTFEPATDSTVKHVNQIKYLSAPPAIIPASTKKSRAQSMMPKGENKENMAAFNKTNPTTPGKTLNSRSSIMSGATVSNYNSTNAINTTNTFNSTTTTTKPNTNSVTQNKRASTSAIVTKSSLSVSTTAPTAAQSSNKNVFQMSEVVSPIATSSRQPFAQITTNQQDNIANTVSLHHKVTTSFEAAILQEEVVSRKEEEIIREENILVAVVQQQEKQTVPVAIAATVNMISAALDEDDVSASAESEEQQEVLQEQVEDVLAYLLESNEVDLSTFRRLSTEGFSSNKIRRLSSMSSTAGSVSGGNRTDRESTDSFVYHTANNSTRNSLLLSPVDEEKHGKDKKKTKIHSNVTSRSNSRRNSALFSPGAEQQEEGVEMSEIYGADQDNEEFTGLLQNNECESYNYNTDVNGTDNLDYYDIYANSAKNRDENADGQTSGGNRESICAPPVICEMDVLAALRNYISTIKVLPTTEEVRTTEEVPEQEHSPVLDAENNVDTFAGGDFVACDAAGFAGGGDVLDSTAGLLLSPEGTNIRASILHKVQFSSAPFSAASTATNEYHTPCGEQHQSTDNVDVETTVDESTSATTTAAAVVVIPEDVVIAIAASKLKLQNAASNSAESEEKDEIPAEVNSIFTPVPPQQKIITYPQSTHLIEALMSGCCDMSVDNRIERNGVVKYVVNVKTSSPTDSVNPMKTRFMLIKKYQDFQAFRTALVSALESSNSATTDTETNEQLFDEDVASSAADCIPPLPSRQIMALSACYEESTFQETRQQFLRKWLEIVSQNSTLLAKNEIFRNTVVKFITN